MSENAPRIAVVIPALNEERSIGRVLGDLPMARLVQVVVVDNGSTDDTARVATEAGARVVPEPRRGYGSACLRGIAEVRKLTPPIDILVFVDADYSDHPEELDRVVAPILEDRADLVIGSRLRGTMESGAMPPQARYGNVLACSLMWALWGYRFTDLGPFRAVRWEALEAMGMRDTTYGWTVEMQIKALRQRLRVTEVPVSYRRRVGVSKISGTVSGTVKAGYKILATVARYGLVDKLRSR